LLETSDNWTLAINDRPSIITAHTDLVWHLIMSCVITNYCINLLLAVCWSDMYGRVAHISSGIVQSSCIGSLLFLIYVNDVSEAFPDTCICMSVICLRH